LIPSLETLRPSIETLIPLFEALRPSSETLKPPIEALMHLNLTLMIQIVI